MISEVSINRDEKVRGRRKCRDESTWDRNKRKLLRNSGQSYKTKTKKTVPAKIFNPEFDCQCRKNCKNKFNQEDLAAFFNSFWKLADFSKQNIFLRGLVKISKVIRKRPRDGTGTEKKSNFEYTVRVKEANLEVCKIFFLGILQISWGRLYRCLVKEEVFSVMDSRGKNIPKNKIDAAHIVAHINSFPAYQSHYSRKDNDQRKYLSPYLNIRKMFDLYVEQCTHENRQPVKEKFYYHVFSTKFNLHFKIPSKDTCRLCDELKIQMLVAKNDEQRRKLDIQKKLHLASADQARAALKADQLKASEEIYVCTFDLQKALAFPKLSTSVAYYKRNLYVYNFGIHSFNARTGFMYVWDETEGGRGSQDVSSCIVKHLKEHASTHKNIVFFSDSCTGQNRNIKMSLTLLKLVHDPALAAETIDLKFMVSGHSFLPNDSEFGVIESSSKKHQNIFVPQDWLDIIKNAKRKKPRYEVTRMERIEFLSTKALEEAIFNRKKDSANVPVNWLKIRWLRFERGQEFIIKFKETLSDLLPFRQINLQKPNQVGRNILSLSSVKQELLYPHRRPISLAKKKDMEDLLPYIPPIHHQFFKNLPVICSTRGAPTHSALADDEIIYEDQEN